jgi:thiol:disulfide interchange protein DsbG
MLIDPQCIYSIRALQMLEPYVANSRLRLSVVPVSVLDYEDKGQSTRSADALLSMPSDKMVAAWQSRDFSNPLTPDGGSRLLDNTLIAQRIGLKGTPTFLWEKPDGTEGRIDGLPDSVPDLLSSIGG